MMYVKSGKFLRSKTEKESLVADGEKDGNKLTPNRSYKTTVELDTPIEKVGGIEFQWKKIEKDDNINLDFLVIKPVYDEKIQNSLSRCYTNKGYAIKPGTKTALQEC